MHLNIIKSAISPLEPEDGLILGSFSVCLLPLSCLPDRLRHHLQHHFWHWYRGKYVKYLRKISAHALKGLEFMLNLRGGRGDSPFEGLQCSRAREPSLKFLRFLLYSRKYTWVYGKDNKHLYSFVGSRMFSRDLGVSLSLHLVNQFGKLF